MAREPRELSSQAEGELAALRLAGVTVTDADIVRINALCWEIESPSHRMALARGCPVEVGGAWLWPMTLAASAWFDEYGCNYKDAEMALAYAMAHGKDDKIEYSGERDIKMFARRLTCRRQPLRLAMSYVIAQDEQDAIPPPKHENHETPTQGDLSAMMMATCGGDVAMWERRVSIGYVAEVLSVQAAQESAGEKGDHSPAWKRANLALAYALEAIEKRGKDGR